MDRPRAPGKGGPDSMPGRVPTGISSAGGVSSWWLPVLFTVPREVAAGEPTGVKEALISTFLQG